MGRRASEKKRIVGNGGTRATKSAVPSSSASILLSQNLVRFDVVPTCSHGGHPCEITVLELPSCTGNPCSSNLMKLRELCVIKLPRVCCARNESWAETPNRANTVEREGPGTQVSPRKLLRQIIGHRTYTALPYDILVKTLATATSVWFTYVQIAELPVRQYRNSVLRNIHPAT